MVGAAHQRRDRRRECIVPRSDEVECRGDFRFQRTEHGRYTDAPSRLQLCTFGYTQLLYGRHRLGMLLDVSGDHDRLDLLQIQAALFAPTRRSALPPRRRQRAYQAITGYLPYSLAA